MKSRLVFAALILIIIATSKSALADDSPPSDSPPNNTSPEPDRPLTKSASLITPSVGLALGKWVGVPVQRLSLGFEYSTSRSVTTGPALVISGLIEPGRTENGLGAHRAELGLSISTAPQTFRAQIGGHLSYAMVERATKDDDAFVRALFGDIGAFGVGIHSAIGLAFPFSRDPDKKSAISPSFRIGVRGSVDLYDGGFGFQGGPMLGIEL